MRLVAVLLSVLGVALVGVAVLAVPGAFWNGRYVLNGGDYAVANRVFEHPLLLLIAAFVVALLALAAGVRARFVRFGAVGVAVVLALVTAGFAVPLTTGPGPRTGGRTSVDHASPDGRYTATVVRWRKLRGEAWLITVRTNDGLNSREHVVGCLDSDDGHAGLDHVVWAGPSSLRVVRPGGEDSSDIHLDATASPDHQLYRGDVGNCYEP
ncbi:hypothetical protein [Cryptosporangium phraense]|uniref:Uncharacterized protein n=1 Tax=Cryptosporangium phraense TaxID=2593070 RepID=A0A545AXM6_9ACTN|nr:hypothetical protein [Cryptosporangium phraense]TQS46082.1 hypothetical protein FL583_06265 [Cryptosporangium phraense]